MAKSLNRATKTSEAPSPRLDCRFMRRGDEHCHSIPEHVNFRVEPVIDVAINLNKLIAWHTMRMGMPHAQKLQIKQ